MRNWTLAVLALPRGARQLHETPEGHAPARFVSQLDA